MCFWDEEKLQQKILDNANVKVSREDVLKTAHAIDRFTSTLLKIGLMDPEDLFVFKQLGLPWYSSWTATTLRKKYSQQSLQQQHESDS
jgi:hypothetical protein